MTEHRIRVQGESEFIVDEPTEVVTNYYESAEYPPIHLWLNRSGVRLMAHLTPEEAEEIAQRLTQLAATAREID